MKYYIGRDFGGDYLVVIKNDRYRWYSRRSKNCSADWKIISMSGMLKDSLRLIKTTTFYKYMIIWNISDRQKKNLTNF